MNGKASIRLAGIGGQGVATAGRILAAAALESGRNVAQSQAYGPESRGGVSRTDVIIAAGDVGFPVADTLDVLVAFEPGAFRTHRPAVAPDGLALADSRIADANGDDLVVPLLDTARRFASTPVMAGVVALGALEARLGLVGIDILERAVAEMTPAARRDANLDALKAGIELAR